MADTSLSAFVSAQWWTGRKIVLLFMVFSYCAMLMTSKSSQRVSTIIPALTGMYHDMPAAAAAVVIVRQGAVNETRMTFQDDSNHNNNDDNTIASTLPEDETESKDGVEDPVGADADEPIDTEVDTEDADYLSDDKPAPDDKDNTLNTPLAEERFEFIPSPVNMTGSLSNPAIVLPTDENTAIALIAMGASRASYIAERCIRSIRASGNFTGYVVLFTDREGYNKYNRTLAWDDKVIVFAGRPEDTKPVHADGITPIRYHKQSTMVFKRFKTLLLKYVDDEPRLRDDTRYVLYLDVDNIVASNLDRFFYDYYVQISAEYDQARAELKTSNDDNDNSPEFSFFSFWRDKGSKDKFWQGGQTMHDRLHSRSCAAAWRHEMDTVYQYLDQPLLLNVYKNFTFYKCKIFNLPNRKKHFSLFKPNLVKNNKNGKNAPTFVHLTGLRTKKFKESLQEKFIRQALDLPPSIDNDNSSSNSTMGNNQNSTALVMVDGISWDEVARAIGSRGQVPSKKDGSSLMFSVTKNKKNEKEEAKKKKEEEEAVQLLAS